MGEFHDAVTTLLETFTSGINVIRTQRGRREREKLPIDSAQKSAESSLSRSLKKNRREVKTAYERDASVAGPLFSSGDEEARSSLASILLRLNSAFVAIIERFTRGKSSQADYQALTNLSNSSRIEAVRTFEQLSRRISHSSLVLASASAHSREGEGERHRRKKRSSRKGEGSSKSKSASSLAITPLGIASTEGWVRPKAGRKGSSPESRKPGGSASPSPHPPRKTSLPKPTSSQVVVPRALPAPQPRLLLPPQAQTSRPKAAPPSPPLVQRTPPPASQNRTANRKSFMSFASDSTKLGEIPEHKWVRPEMFDAAEGGGMKFPITTFYPIEPYQAPEKQKGRLRRLLRL